MMPLHLHQPLRRVLRVLLAMMAMSLSVLTSYSAPTPEQNSAGGGITAVEENGHRVWVNDYSPKKAEPAMDSLPAQRSVLVYWSNTEHRWKPVPTPSKSAMLAARTAASEVRGFVTAQPRTVERSTAAANPNYAGLARGYKVSASDIDLAIEKAAAKNGVDPNLVRALIKVESNFNPNAVSHKGAMGLMQLMPSTASGLRVSNPFDPQQNVDAGVRHLKQLLNANGGDVRLTLAAYNAGQGTVRRSHGVPRIAETQTYVKRITDLYWNHDGRSFAAAPRASGLPARTFRSDDGVVHMTNTE
jgi:soluble lytic murein transglycosylase-like protein